MLTDAKNFPKAQHVGPWDNLNLQGANFYWIRMQENRPQSSEKPHISECKTAHGGEVFKTSRSTRPRHNFRMLHSRFPCFASPFVHNCQNGVLPPCAAPHTLAYDLQNLYYKGWLYKLSRQFIEPPFINIGHAVSTLLKAKALRCAPLFRAACAPRSCRKGVRTFRSFRCTLAVRGDGRRECKSTRGRHPSRLCGCDR